MPEAPVDESAQAPAAEPQPVARTAEDIAREQQEFAAKQRRAKQTVRNLLIALLACLGVVVVLLVAVPRDDSSRLSTVDFHQVADGLQDSAAMTLAVPDVDDRWIANRADYTPDTDTGLDVWYVGLRTPNKQFISITQSSEVNATWQVQQLTPRKATGTTTIDGVEFTVYDQRDDSDYAGRSDYALTADVDGTTLIFNGTADDDEFAQLVTATLTSMGAGSEAS